MRPSVQLKGRNKAPKKAGESICQGHRLRKKVLSRGTDGEREGFLFEVHAEDRHRDDPRPKMSGKHTFQELLVLRSDPIGRDNDSGQTDHKSVATRRPRRVSSMNGLGNTEEKCSMRLGTGRDVLRLMNDRDHAERPAKDGNPVESDGAYFISKHVERWGPKFLSRVARSLERVEEAGTLLKKLLVGHSMRPRSPLAIRT